jgi:hypothetical protein
MANNTPGPKPLGRLRSDIDRDRSLTLNETTLGAEQFRLLRQIFPHQRDFVLSHCGDLSSASQPLTFSGTFEQLFPWETVHAGVCLFDLASVRHAIIQITKPEAAAAYAYLSQYSVDPGEPISRAEVAPTTGLGSYVQEIRFSSAASHLIFSTLDYTLEGADLSFYPDAWKAEFPVRHVNQGLNFSADVTLGEGLRRSLQTMLNGFDSISPKHRCVISGDEYGPRFRLTRATTGSLTIAPLQLQLTGTTIVMPLARPLGARLYPQILVEGTVKVDIVTVQVTAALHPYYPELSLSFSGFPSLRQLITQVGLNLSSLPVPLSKMLDVKLSTLTAVLNLQEKSVSEISFSLTKASEVKLLRDVVSLKPELTLKPKLTAQIYSLFDEELRSIEGRLTGKWTFEGIMFTTELAYPSSDFYAGMDPGQHVSTKGFVQRLLPGIDLPELTFTAMQIEGSVLQESFWARIEATIGNDNDTTWGFRASRFKEIRLGMLYADQQMTHCGVECTLSLAGVGIVLSGLYDAGRDGLQFDGSTDPATPIDIKGLLADLKELSLISDTVPSAIESFKIKSLKLSFNTHSKDFSFICDGSLQIEAKNIKGSITLDLKHRQDGSFSTHFSGQITIGHLQFALIFDSSDKPLLAATFHDAQGQPQKIKALIEDISPTLAGPVPSSLTFTLHDALLGRHGSAQDSKWLFAADIEGGLNLSDIRFPDFPLISQSALPVDQTLKLAVQVAGANKEFTKDEVAVLNALSANLRLPNGGIGKGLALAASLRLGEESRQLSLPIALKKNGSSPDPGRNPLEYSPVPVADETSAATPHSEAHIVSDDGMQWAIIQKSFGPVHFERVGIAYSDGKITGLLDAALSAGGLTIALDGLSVTSPLSRFDPTFSLRGLGIDYQNGPVEIAGSFLKQTRQEGGAAYTSFAGLAVLRTRQLSLSAIGSYALKDGHPSLFIYAVLDYPLGGPSFFYVTGLAAGFGYNRGLTIPAIDQVEAFPLIQAATVGQNGSGVPSLPAGQKQQQELLTARLEALEEYIPRSVGEHFLAIGVRFTSFKKINSFALLTAKFGRELEFDLLGISTLSVPKVAEAQLALKATFNPGSGFLGIRAQLTPKSYILSSACHLTGGFAFHSWFKDQTLPDNQAIRAGDFVLTLGGYHPAYEPPAHYPRVPRLGFNWQVDDYLQLKGDAYYAMTPHALMAGAHLEATWHKDQLKAWFIASADFLISWEPYYYDARLYIDLGASYSFDLFGNHTITADLGADLHLWGPDFSGEARIHWLFLSFTVSFVKSAPTGLKPIDWNAFKAAFLPEKNQICGIAAQQGLIRQLKDGDQERWIMNPNEFALVTNSVIPSTEAMQTTKLDNNRRPNISVAIKLDPGLAVRPLVAVRPVAVDSMQSTHTITITRDVGTNVELVSFDYTPVLKAMPAALWGAPQWDAKKEFLRSPDLHDHEPLLEKTLCGFEIRPQRRHQPGPTAPFQPHAYETELIPDAFEWEDWTLPDTDLQGKDARAAVTANKDPGILTKKDILFESLGFANSGTGFLPKR